MDEEEVSEYTGACCPVCRSDSTKGAAIDAAVSGAIQACWCLTCNAEWIARYKLIGCNIVATIH